MVKQLFLISMILLCLVTASTSDVEWAMKVDQIIQANSMIPIKDYPIYENSMREYLKKQFLDLTVLINTVSIDSQSLLNFSSLKLIFILGIKTLVSDGTSQDIIIRRVNQALISSAWNLFLVREFGLGIIISVNIYDMTKIQLPKQRTNIFDRIKLDDNSEPNISNIPSSISTAPSVSSRFHPSTFIEPSTIILRFPTSHPSSSENHNIKETSENYISDLMPNTSTIPSDGLSSLPPSYSSIRVPSKPHIIDISSESNLTTALNHKDYKSKIVMDLPGLLNTLSDEETVRLETTTEIFIVTYIPSITDLIFEVLGVKVKKQGIEKNGVVADDAERFLVVELEIYGQGWSRQTNILEDYSMDTSIKKLFSTQKIEFLNHLIQVGGIFRHIIVKKGTSTTPDNLGNNQTLIIIISVVACLLCLLFIFVFIIHRYIRYGKDLVETNDEELDLVIDALSASHLESINNGIRGHKFPIQHSRDGSSKFSLGSPSQASYSEIENWSISSVSLSRRLFLRIHLLILIFLNSAGNLICIEACTFDASS
jgi:hypothetical protein